MSAYQTASTFPSFLFPLYIYALFHHPPSFSVLFLCVFFFPTFFMFLYPFVCLSVLYYCPSLLFHFPLIHYKFVYIFFLIFT